jgi:uncharacterized protein
VRSCLIDSGPLIALFAVDDHHHARFDALVKELSVGGLRLVTTWPCIVEASYLLEIPQRFEILKWIELGGAVVGRRDACLPNIEFIVGNNYGTPLMYFQAFR